MNMKIIISEKQLKEMKKEIDEISDRNVSKAERIYKLIRATPFGDRDRIIRNIAKIIEE